MEKDTVFFCKNAVRFSIVYELLNKLSTNSYLLNS
jgi:hypothetical protein